MHLFTPNFIWYSVTQFCKTLVQLLTIILIFALNIFETAVVSSPFTAAWICWWICWTAQTEPLEGHWETGGLFLPCASCPWISYFSMWVCLFLPYLSSLETPFFEVPLVRNFLEIQNNQIHLISLGPCLLSPSRSYISIVMWLSSMEAAWSSQHIAFVSVPP